MAREPPPGPLRPQRRTPKLRQESQGQNRADLLSQPVPVANGRAHSSGYLVRGIRTTKRRLVCTDMAKGSNALERAERCMHSLGFNRAYVRAKVPGILFQTGALPARSDMLKEERALPAVQLPFGKPARCAKSGDEALELLGKRSTYPMPVEFLQQSQSITVACGTNANARNAGDRASASTSAEGGNARNARDRCSASTSAKGADARNARDRASWRPSAKGADARNAGDQASASTSAEGVHARNARDRASASTSAEGVNARSAGARASASTSAEGAYARNARDRASASTSASGADARSARARASASTSAEGANARNDYYYYYYCFCC